MSGIYFHIPFCKSRCAYCAFYSTADKKNASLKDRYVDALCKEIEIRYPSEKYDIPRTLYMGGGTPSQLNIGQLDKIIGHIPNFDSIKEITIECNPDDITKDYALGLNRIGINRISMGIQTFNDSLLQFLNRRHTSKKVFEAIDILHDVGIDNISTDLIYGLPGQSVSDIDSDIQKLISTDIKHISCYCLSYEEGTPLSTKLHNKEILETDDDTEACMYNLIMEKLSQSGFEHYEISNFAKTGYRSQHNSSYWDGTHYIGIGAGAHSFDGTKRSWNICNIAKYIRHFEKQDDSSIVEYEMLTDTDRYNELVMTRLRTSDGLPNNIIPEKFAPYFHSQIKPFIDNGYIVVLEEGNKGETYRLSKKSLFISDSIISSLFMA
ncbi:MAG: radical SAM family heme chaperone HemW [Prevotella sp.]|nr:radical SAM family heme chaperone HemW [Candidatus Equicola stercoris]